MTTQEPETEQPGTEQQETEQPETEHGEPTPATPATPPAPGEKHALRSAVLGSVLYLAFFTVMTLFNLHPPKLHPVAWAVITPLTTVIYLLILVYTIRLITRLSLTARLETLVMVGALFVFAAINPAVRDVIWGLLHGEQLGKIFALMGSADLPPALQIFVPFFLILTGVYFGQLLTRIIREPGMLVPVSLIAALIDFWGVYWGPVSAMSEQAPAAVSNMATAATAAAATPDAVLNVMPQQLKIFSSISPPQNIGIGDFVFLAFFLACAHRLGFSARRTMWGIFFGLLASTVIMSLDGMTLFGHDIAIQYLPGLVFICAGAMLANLRAWRLSAQEWAMTGVIVAILLAFISVSIVRAEMGKPHESRVSFTLTATSTEALINQAIQRSTKDFRDAGEVVTVAGGFQYVVKRKQPELTGWEVLVLIRPAKGHGAIHQIDIAGMRLKAGADSWRIDAARLSKSHPESEELQQIRLAQPMPAKALSLVDQLDAGPAIGKNRLLILRLSAKKMTLAGEQGNVLKEYDVKQYD